MRRHKKEKGKPNNHWQTKRKKKRKTEKKKYFKRLTTWHRKRTFELTEKNKPLTT